MKTQFKDFSPEIWNTIHKQVDHALQQKGPHYAALDADGTLWDNDAGNGFFNYEIDNKLVPLPADAWGEVYKIKAEDPRKAFLWMAQIHKGVPFSTVQKWARHSFEESKIQVFPAIKKLVQYLKDRGVEIFIVTASVKWSVEPCVEQLRIDADHVLGVKTKIENGIVTDIQDGPVTWRQGKVEALLERTGGKKPFLAVGNTMGDFWLLEDATHIRLAVRTDGSDAGLNKDKNISQQELNLYKEATARGWLTHNFL